MDKKTFVEYMEFMRDYNNSLKRLQALSDEIKERWDIVVTKNNAVDELDRMIWVLAALTNPLTYDYISWWVRKDVKRVSSMPDEDICTKTPEELYDFLMCFHGKEK